MEKREIEKKLRMIQKYALDAAELANDVYWELQADDGDNDELIENLFRLRSGEIEDIEHFIHVFFIEYVS